MTAIYQKYYNLNFFFAIVILIIFAKSFAFKRVTYNVLLKFDKNKNCFVSSHMDLQTFIFSPLVLRYGISHQPLPSYQKANMLWERGYIFSNIVKIEL